ncbi:ester cyclase [Pseudaminobacter sp. NGMCC 1.201702]|uniref:ester cyclase n=1 Tax=Pseudaminobacter sp. NGMCC 1.201702 TaxID=3391825 RepID=UPI0039F09E9A
MSELNKAQIRRVIDNVYNRGDLAFIDEVAASDLVIHASSQEILGREGAKQYVAELRAGFPDLHFTVEEQIAEGDMVVTRWTARGTHRGKFQRIPATGRGIQLTGTDIDRLVAGKVVECWAHVDELGLMRQLGAVEAGAAESNRARQ